MEDKWNKYYSNPIVVAFFVCIWIYVLGAVIYGFAQGKEVFLPGFGVTIVGFLSFLKAKIWMIRNKKLFSIGCDGMPQKESFFYSAGYILMFLGGILSFRFW